MDAGSALAKVPIFCDLPESKTSELVAACRSQRYAANETVVMEGDEGFSMFVILSGQVEVSRLNDAGERVPFHRLGPGDYFGEMALLGGMPRTADVATVVPSQLLVIERAAFVRSVLGTPELCMRVLGHLCRRIRQSDDARISKLSVRQRLVKALLELAVPATGKDGVEVLAVEISRQQLADRILARRETVSREVSRLAAERLVRVRGKLVVIPRPQRLLELLEE